MSLQSSVRQYSCTSEVVDVQERSQLSLSLYSRYFLLLILYTTSKMVCAPQGKSSQYHTARWIRLVRNSEELNKLITAALLFRRLWKIQRKGRRFVHYLKKWKYSKKKCWRIFVFRSCGGSARKNWAPTWNFEYLPRARPRAWTRGPPC